MRVTRWAVVLLLMVAVLSVGTVAQDDEAGDETEDTVNCPALVQKALELTERNCELVGQNQVCYGHSILEAAGRSGLPTFSFEEPGDIEDVIAMQSLSLSAMDLTSQVWGVILMQLQAGLEAADQNNVTFVVFGDTELNAAIELVEVTAQENVNVRVRPAVDQAPLTVVEAETVLIANGRSEDGDWLRVQVPDDMLQIGWVASDLVTPQGDLDVLEVVALDADLNPAALYGPMQAFYFGSGDDDAPCEEAPNSGLLVQTPEGEASVTLWIDEVIIELNATAFVQAQPGGDLTINILQGSANVTAGGSTQTAVAGTSIAVPLNEDLQADGEPEVSTAYDPTDLLGLPLTLLPRTVIPAEPLNVAEGAPVPGSWRFSWGVESMTCPDGEVIPFESSGELSTLTVAQDGSSLDWGGTYTQQAVGVYTRSYVDAEGNLYQDTLTVLSANRVSGQSVIDFAAKLCTLTVPFSLTWVN